MTYQEWFECVEHRENDCSVCSIVDNGVDNARSNVFSGLVSAFWYSSWGIWVLVGLTLLAAYTLAIHELYNIVGGMN